MLSVIRTITYSFSTVDSFLLLHLTLDRPKLQHVSTAWNCATPADAKELEGIQRKRAAMCQYRFFSHDIAAYEDYPITVKLYALYDRRFHLDALLFVSVPSCLNCCLSRFDTTGIAGLPRHFRTPSLFTATNITSPSTGCVPAANCV